MTEQRYTIQSNNATKPLQNICKEVLIIARDHRQTKALACFYFLKQHFQNSRIYDYRSRMRELSSLIGVCEKTLYTYFRYLKKNGMLITQGNNLQLISTRKLKAIHNERKKYQISISENETLQTIEARLIGKVLGDHVRRIEHHRKVKRFERRYHRSRNRNIKRPYESGAGYSLSIRNLQKLFNMGQIKATRAIILLNELGVIHTTRSRAQIAANAPRETVKYAEGLPGYFFYRNGRVYVQYGNQHELLEYPLSAKEMTYRQYIMTLKNRTENQRFVKINTTL